MLSDELPNPFPFGIRNRLTLENLSAIDAMEKSGIAEVRLAFPSFQSSVSIREVREKIFSIMRYIFGLNGF